MSILIKGIEMPKDNTVLLRIYPESDGVIYVEQLDIDDDILDKYWAVPVPEHGRLIDGDALIAWFEEWYDPNADLEICHVIDILDDNSVAPTIIPAEEE